MWLKEKASDLDTGAAEYVRGGAVPRCGAPGVGVVAQVRWSTLALALTGCYGEASYVCSDAVFLEVRYQTQVDCARSRRVTLVARDVLASTGAWTHVDLASLVLVVHPVQSWRSDLLGIDVDGQQGPGVLEVGADYRALVHECLHARDWLEFDLARLTAPLHQGWAADGRDETIRTWWGWLATQSTGAGK